MFWLLTWKCSSKLDIFRFQYVGQIGKFPFIISLDLTIHLIKLSVIQNKTTICGEYCLKCFHLIDMVLKDDAWAMWDCAKYTSLLYKKKVKRRWHETETVESVKERENYEWTEESRLIRPHPWHCWNTQTRKLGIADETNSVWPVDDATGCQVLATLRVNKHKRTRILYTFGHLT